MANVDDIPARPDGLQLIGQMEGSGYRTPPSLVRRPDGQTLQLTPLLYAVLEAVDGRRTCSEIAAHVSASTARSVTAADVETLVEQRLRPMGLLLQADGSELELPRANPLLGLRFKVAVTDPSVTRRLTDPFRVLFNSWVWIPVVIAFGLLAWWLLMERGLAAATYQAFAKPSLLVLVLAVTILSAGFHEFGHAAAAARGGARPGVMGAGLYLLWPAFYTDVSDTYRLDRWSRIRADLGGLYFNAIVAVGIAAAWLISGWDALLLVIAAQIVQMIRQLIPLVRFDGYHVLADLIGVPDLFSRIGPILASFWPTRWRDPRVAQLTWRARLLVTLWVLIVTPVLLFTLFAMVIAIPRLIGTAWAGVLRERAQAVEHWAAGNQLDAIGSVIAMLAIGLPILALGILLIQVVRRAATWLWQRTQGHRARRLGAMVLMAGTVAAVAFAWWPRDGRYAPIQPFEGGTLADLASTQHPPAITALSGTAAQPAGGQVRTVLPSATSLPAEGEPRLALVLIPKAGAGSDATDPAWVFPFDRPLPPEPGDNQALSVNTADHTAAYDVAVAMVWVTGEDPVLNTNEAYAFASCSDCVTVAVAFQVVIIVGRADVIVPQNLSAAVNYECFECITTAIASQLVVTVSALPGIAEQLALAELWDEIQAYAASIPSLPLADVLTQLDEYKQQILAILGVAALPEPATTPGPSESLPDSSFTPSDTPAPDTSGTPAGGTVPPPTPTPFETDPPPPGTVAPTSEPAPTATQDASASPTIGPAESLETSGISPAP